MSRAHAVALAACAFAALSFALSLATNVRTSATWDEPAYLGAGLTALETRDYRLHPDAPPLPGALGALAARTLDPQLPFADPSWPLADEWSFGHQLVNVWNRAMGRDLVFRARLPIHALGALGVLVVFAWARRLAGNTAGIAAAFLAALCPSWIAHSAVLSCDVAVSVFMAAATWRAGALATKPATGWREALELGGLAFLALASKLTALALGVVLPVVVLGASELERRGGRPALGRDDGLRLLLRSLVVALALVEVILYPGEHGAGRYLTALSAVYKNIDPDVRFFFLGEYSSRGWPLYAAASLLFKSTLALLWFGAAGVGITVGRARERGELVGPIALAVIVVGGSLLDPAAFGLRRVLPALPGLYVLGGVAFGAVADAPASRRGQVLLVTMGVVLLSHAVSSLRAFPAYIPYLNEVTRGFAESTDLFTDSNVDWGQALPDLAREIEARKPARVKLLYYGRVDPELYGVHAETLEVPRDLERPEKGVLYAISASRLVELRGLAREGKLKPEADWLSRARPVARAGDAIFLYEAPVGLLAPGQRR